MTALAMQSAAAYEAMRRPADDLDSVDRTVAEVRSAFHDIQASDGHWLYELEADATIPSEYVMLEHYLDEIDDALEHKIAVYLRDGQGEHGGWPLFYGGDFNISATVKAYYALKLIGDDIDAPHMRRAREAVLARGGAARANVFTRFALALFDQIPWCGTPVMPVEIMHLPSWFPFHLDKVSYWSRAVIAPLLVLTALKPKARNPRGIHIQELFVTPPAEEKTWNLNPTGAWVGEFFLLLDRALQKVEPHFPKGPRKRAIQKAVDFFAERLNGEDGLGAIYPAMANSVMALDALGYPKDHPDLIIAKKSIKNLLVEFEDRAYCQPCVSPIWDTSLAAHAMLEAGDSGRGDATGRALDWLRDRQILDVVGDWAAQRPDLRPGGWAFQYWNDHYPDVDDSAVVALALHRADPDRYKESIDRAAEWVLGMQSANGGWGAFDADNEHYKLNSIPFADHGALLDPPTSDVTARCLGMLAQLGYTRDHPAVAKAVDFLIREQEEDGSWFGRWGTNYVYGTWSVLCALNAIGEDPNQPYLQKTIAWLRGQQGEDGGWGEDGATYWADRRGDCKESTPSQTAWALMALMAMGEVDSETVKRGVDFLMTAPRQGTKWDEQWYTAVGFPRVFYLRYHGYSAYFPLWALARYRNLRRANDKSVAYGM
ncbi:MAG: squalene--hopene cyclase [Alphaproteobacteria bacterium]|nr:squalene--hopene cyclase [Alphaproteobacteria bacterium]